MSYWGPAAFANTLVGAVFLGASWWLGWRRRDEIVNAAGLGLGGLAKAASIEWRVLARDTLRAFGWAFACAAVFFPPFWIAYRYWWHVAAPFRLTLDLAFVDLMMNQILVVALPEEAFFRGIVQSNFEHTWVAPKLNILGARIGWGVVVTSMLFALGHLITIPVAGRLAVFFPSLVFGWLRIRTGGIGAGIIFHAMCNAFSATLASGYGLR